MGFHNPGYAELREGRMALADAIVRCGADAAKLAAEGRFSVEPMDYNAIRAADLAALADIAETLRRPAEAAAWRARAERVRQGLRKTVFDGEPFDLEGAAEAPVRMASTGQFIAMIGGFLTRPEMDGLVARLDEPRFWTAFPVPTSPTDDPTFAPTVYWRGNVWPSVNWLVYEALVRNGYRAVATKLAERTAALVEKSGYREYYDPLTGDGLGGVRFSWATAFIDMFNREVG
jgi:glycogen debranching enzyme